MTKNCCFCPFILWAIATVFFNLPTLCKDNFTAAKFLVTGLLSVYFSWFVGRWLIIGVRHKYPGLEKIRQRLITLGLLSLPAVVVLVIQRLLFFDYVVYNNQPKLIGFTPKHCLCGAEFILSGHYFCRL
jgi:hypothetical protein